MRVGATRYGSDLIVDLLVEAEIDYVALNPGATFRGIHDSIAQCGTGPQFVLCLHEGIAVSVAHGYAKAAGKPMATLLHDIVGLQQGSMAIFNAWCDRAAMLVLGGSGPMSKANRRPWIDWIHTASAQGELVRDYVKWDDEPRDASSVPESFARGLRTASAAPAGPVYLCYDVDLQEQRLSEAPDDLGPAEFKLERYPALAAPQPGSEQVELLAAELRRAERPLIAAGYAGEGGAAFAELAELAELLGAPVVDTGVRLPIASDHPLNATAVDGIVEEADLILRLDAEDPLGLLGTRVDSRTAIHDVSLAQLRLRSWAHDYQALDPARSRITAGADATVAGLVAALRAHGPDPTSAGERRAANAARIAATRARWQAEAAVATIEDRGDHRHGVALPRLIHELGEALAGQRFVLANGTNARLEHRLWGLREPGQYLGWHGGGGLGYGPGAAIGAALANRDAITVGVQADGDLLFVPGALWTMAHLELPILVVVNNNRQYGNTVEHAASIARDRGRDPERRYVGAGLADPPVDFAGLSRSMGVWGSGPIADPESLADALEQAITIVRGGRPALLDVLTPGF